MPKTKRRWVSRWFWHTRCRQRRRRRWWPLFAVLPRRRWRWWQPFVGLPRRRRGWRQRRRVTLTGTFPTSAKLVYWLAAAQRFLFIANFLPIFAVEPQGKFVLRLHIGKIQESSARWSFAARICSLRRDDPWKLLDKNPVHHEKAFQLQGSDASPQVGQKQLALFIRPDRTKRG